MLSGFYGASPSSPYSSGISSSSQVLIKPRAYHGDLRTAMPSRFQYYQPSARQRAECAPSGIERHAAQLQCFGGHYRRERALHHCCTMQAGRCSERGRCALVSPGGSGEPFHRNLQVLLWLRFGVARFVLGLPRRGLAGCVASPGGGAR
jgi:hypothetical protein